MELRNNLYYLIKPLLPAASRLAVRRWVTVRKRHQVGNIWPILQGSDSPPNGWSGWPEGKQFAVVLTHDVEGLSGLNKCRSLMSLEMRMGFRSSFGFIPEGGYSVTDDLRDELVRNGFEITVHDLNHDGKLYRSKSEFSRKAVRINHYLEKWGSVGFRSGFMLRNLDWLHELNIEYDASTFDTDPFEPQPDGAGTVFPFWVPRPCHPDTVNSSVDIGHSPCSGYVELPYTLPQDSTLFVLLRERQPDIWLRKLDWIAERGGMVLLDTHPDYMNFNGHVAANNEFQVACYEEFLSYLLRRYCGKYWHALPREVAAYSKKMLAPRGIV